MDKSGRRDLERAAHRPAGDPFTAEADRLVQSPPARFLWARVRLRPGLATPSLRALTIRYRRELPDLLPRVCRRDPGLALPRALPGPAERS